MPVEVKVPTVGESITTGVLGVWNKKAGDYVQSGDILFEIETDKVTSEVYADVAGVLQQLVPAGTTVQVGQVVATIDEKATAPVAVAAASAPEAKASAPEKPANGSAAKTEKTELPARGVTPAKGDGPLSPAVRFQLGEKGLKPEEVTGTGKEGRILKGDVLAHVPATGKAAATPGAGAGRTTRKALSPLRKRIADRLVSAQQEAAILTTFNEVDMTNIIALRSAYQERFTAKHGIKIGFMSFFLRAVIQALKAVPAINGRIDGGDVVENHYYDIGVAISTDKGLLVPVIRDAEQLSLAQIEMAISDYAKKARAGKITLTDLEGGVFTITNGGVFGSLLSTPILNPPQSGILGMHSIQDRPVAINGRVEIRPMMYLALSYDHRMVDGKQAVTFLVRVKELVENPGLALLDI